MHDSKPFDATPSRLAKARRDGDIPHSTELPAALALGGGCTALLLTWQLAGAAASATVADAARGSLSVGPYFELAVCAFAPSIAAMFCAVGASVAVAGGLALKWPRFEFGKLQPGPGLRRLLSAHSATYAVRAITAASVASVAMFPVLRDGFWSVTAGLSAAGLAALTVDLVQRLLVTAVTVGIAFGIVEALFERIAWRRRLRMSVEEMKRDLKESEGDPHLRNRRRVAHRALIRGSISRLSEASFVIANPTHVAVALEYRPPEITVPRVLIRAVDAGAQLVKAKARSLGLPVIEDVALARTLLETTHIEESIPRSCYSAVARIVASLIRMENGK